MQPNTPWTRSRQTKWKVKQFQKGNCINCGETRKGSPYKRLCVECGKKVAERGRERAGCNAWRPGKPGRPPKTVKKAH